MSARDNMELGHKIIVGDKKNTNFLYIFEEKQFYTRNGGGKKGDYYRCHHRSCPSRVLLSKSGVCTKKLNAKSHNHTDDCEKRYNELVVLDKLREKCSDLSSIASGKRMANTRDLCKQIIIE